MRFVSPLGQCSLQASHQGHITPSPHERKFTWSSDISKRAGSDVIKRLEHFSLVCNLTGLKTRLRWFLVNRWWNGKLLSQIGEETEASYVLLTNADLNATCFHKNVQLRNTAATTKKEKTLKEGRPSPAQWKSIWLCTRRVIFFVENLFP